jgi:rRNA processing protein Gar1
MTIDTLDYNSKPGEVIPIDDIDGKLIEPYMLTKEESRLKENIWKFQNADYLARQKEIKKNKRN